MALAPAVQGARYYVVNQKPSGRVHRLVTASLPREKRRALCGWRAGRSVAFAVVCSRIERGKLCRKCFSKSMPVSNGDEDDAIEEDT